MIFVTGGTGLVGSHLLYSLVSKGEKVKALKRKVTNTEIIRKVFNCYTGDETLFDKIQWIEGDILDVLSLETALENVDIVYHCAAIVSFHPEDHDRLLKVNVEGTANVVNACLHAKVKKLCHVSSTAAIGKSLDGSIITEETEWQSQDVSIYSKSKYLAEQEVWRGKEEGLKIVIVNPSIIIGPGEWGRSSTNVFLQVWKGLAFYTLGGNAFVDVRDLVKCMMLLIEKDTDGQRYLVLSENWMFKDFFLQLAVALGKKPPRIRANSWMTNLAWRLVKPLSKLTQKKPVLTRETAQSAQSMARYSNEKIKNELGFKFMPVEKSIHHTANLFLKQIPA